MTTETLKRRAPRLPFVNAGQAILAVEIVRLENEMLDHGLALKKPDEAIRIVPDSSAHLRERMIYAITLIMGAPVSRALGILVCGLVASVVFCSPSTAAEAPGGNTRLAPPAAGEPLRLTLRKAIEVALENNLDLQITRLGRDAAIPDVSSAESVFHPQVGLSLDRSFNKSVGIGDGVAGRGQSRVLTAFVEQQLPTGGSVVLSTDLSRDDSENSSQEWAGNHSFSVTQPLMRGGRMFVARRGITDAESNLRIANANLNSQVLAVALATKSAYYGVILANDTIEVTQAAINRSKALIESSEALLGAQLVTIRDVLSARIKLTQDSETLVSAKFDLETARNSLLDVLGYPTGIEVVLLDSKIGFKQVRLDLKKLIATALDKRPEIIQLDEELETSRLNIRVAENSILPQVDMVGSYSRAETGSGYGKVLGADGYSWNLGVTFSIPIGNVAARAALRKARISHASLRRSRLQTERSIELNVRNTIIKLERSLARRTTLEQVLDQAKQLEAVAKARFSRGLATNIDITDAQTDIRDAETDLLAATIDYNVGLAELEAAIAGPI